MLGPGQAMLDKVYQLPDWDLSLRFAQVMNVMFFVLMYFQGSRDDGDDDQMKMRRQTALMVRMDREEEPGRHLSAA